MTNPPVQVWTDPVRHGRTIAKHEHDRELDEEQTAGDQRREGEPPHLRAFLPMGSAEPDGERDHAEHGRRESREPSDIRENWEQPAERIDRQRIVDADLVRRQVAVDLARPQRGPEKGRGDAHPPEPHPPPPARR
jgi:uncharacterized protein YjcR